MIAVRQGQLRGRLPHDLRGGVHYAGGDDDAEAENAPHAQNE